MARKKCKCPPAGAPEWMVTFGDMVTLLLCFFVLIVSFSEIKKEDIYQAVVEEIQKSFGMKGGGGKLPTQEDPELTLIERLEAVRLYQMKEPTRSNTVDPGAQGRERRVTRVREGDLFTTGTVIVFEPGSAQLSEQGKQALRDIAGMAQGLNNLIEVRGHAASMELEQVASDYEDLWGLTFARARAVFDYMTGIEVGLSPKRFRLTANADREPLRQRTYSVSGQKPNRRVEVFVSESLVDDFQQPQVANAD